MRLLVLFSLAALPQAWAIKPDDTSDLPGAVHIDLYVDYTLPDQPNVRHDEVASFINGENATLKYTVASQEKQEVVNLVGVGGFIRDADTNALKYNLTAEAILPPVLVKPNDTHSIDQTFAIDFVPGTYVLAPEVYIVLQNEVKMIPITPQLIRVADVAVSFLDPQFLALVALFGALVAMVLTFTYNRYVATYLQGTAPLPAAAKRAARREHATGVATGAYNADWIPKEHLKKAPKTKKIR